MDNKSTAEIQVESRLTPELLGLVKRSTLESQQKQKLEQSNGVKVPENNDQKIKLENEIKTNGNNKQAEDDDDIKIINEKINVKQDLIKSDEVKEEKIEKIEIKLKPEEFILDDEEIGFPNYLKGWITRGRTIPINKKTWTEIDIDGEDAILECPSQVVPLFIKKPHLFPPKEVKKEIEKKPVKEEVKEEDKKEDKKEEGKEDKKEEKDNKEKDKKEEEINKQQQSNDKDQAVKNGQTNNTNNEPNKLTMLTVGDYYKSSVGSFLMGIGMRRCQETYLKDSIRQTQKVIRKEGELDEHLNVLNKQNEQFEDCKTVNSIYTFKQNKCTMCDFKTDCDSVMQYHLSIPHLSNRKEFKCNFCTFLTRDARVIIYHFLNDHKKHCNIELPPQLYTCPTCNYESNQKAKAANHMAKCVKVFNEDKVLQTLDAENELPAITSKLITQDDLKSYEATIQALKPVVMNPGMQMPVLPGLPRGLQQQILIMQQQQFARQKLAKPIKSINNTNQRSLANIRPNINNNSNNNSNNNNNLANMANLLNSQQAIAALAAGANGANLINNLNFAKAPQLYHMLQTGSHNQLLTNLQQQVKQQTVIIPTSSANKIQPQLNNNNRTIVPPISSATMVQKNFINMKTAVGISKNSKDINGKSDTFVICEICDGYIKDLEQLRTHMQWIHKVVTIRRKKLELCFNLIFNLI